MKRSAIFIFITLVLFVFSGCGDDNKDDTATIPALFEDHFSYTLASPWTPVNGWSCSASGKWDISTGGVSGNALEWPGTGIYPLINSYTGTDYQVSVRFKPVNMHAGGWPVYVLARVQDDDNWYGAGIYYDGLTGSYLYLTIDKTGITTNYGDVLFKSGSLDSGTYYTLTIKVQGTTITVTCSGGGNNATYSKTDTEFSSGKVGMMVYDGVGAYNILFDDFAVTGL